MLCALVCPSCNSPMVAVKPANRCPVCGSAFSPTLRDAIQRAANVKRPFLISFGMYFSFFFCAVSVFSLARGWWLGLGLFGAGVPGVSHAEFLFWQLLPTVLSILIMFSIAWGFWKQRLWSRQLVMVFWCLSIPFLLFMPIVVLVMGLILFSLGVVSAWWYFYRKTNVAAYFSELELRGALPSTVEP